MSERQLILAQLLSVRKELMEVVDRLEDSILAWAPGPGMRTIHGQIVEILMTEANIHDRVLGRPKRAVKEIEAPYRAMKSVGELRNALSEVRQESLRILESLGELRLGEKVETSAEFARWLELEYVPVSELFRFLARHESYHAGQLVSYLWARGDDPYEW